MIFNLINNFIKISFYSGIGFGLFGLFISIIECWYKATNTRYPILIEYNQLHINYFIEYIESILFLIIIFFIGGFVFPLCMLILTILYFINRQTKLIK
jgi:hypothetical protein